MFFVEYANMILVATLGIYCFGLTLESILCSNYYCWVPGAVWLFLKMSCYLCCYFGCEQLFQGIVNQVMMLG